MPETILIVDDEDSVRQTFREWLTASLPEVKTLAVADAAAALRVARDEPVDLAILDWNLGAGHNGLQLLEDLQVFRPDLIAILVTGYAQQATPLDALRMGVRDYFDKSHDLSRDSLEAAVQRQLRLIRPLKRERDVREQLSRFQSAAEEALGYVRAGASSPGADAFRQIVQHLLSYLKAATRAQAVQLVWRSYQEKPTPRETRLRYREGGAVSEETQPPFGRTLAAAALQGEGIRSIDLNEAATKWKIQLLPEESEHSRAVLLPVLLSPDLFAVIELLGWVDDSAGDQLSALNAALPVLTDLLRLAAGQRETQKLLLEALESALTTSRMAGDDETVRAAQLKASVQSSLDFTLVRELESPEAIAVTDQLKVLTKRHGPLALRRVLAIISEMQKLLDEQQGLEASA